MMIGRIVGIGGVMNRDRGNATTGFTAAAVAVALETIIDDAITDETTGIAITSATDGGAGAAMEVVVTNSANAIVITSVLNATAAEAAVTKRNFKPYSCFRFPFSRAAECVLCCIVSRLFVLLRGIPSYAIKNLNIIPPLPKVSRPIPCQVSNRFRSLFSFIVECVLPCVCLCVRARRIG
uniref:(northern house mosquito) hypothetical protein n=1 Tax=Culex pipiens TaxID=7175 RepID=A0A8D8HZI4_CULPI